MRHPMTYVGAEAPVRTRRSRLLVATTIGNALEFFDFTVFGFFAIVIGKNFFSPLNEHGQLLMSATTFALGFLVRPLGGILIGIYADRAGRRAAMTLTLSLMALGACMVGLAPTYDSAGMAAPVIVVLARLIQGFSAGGEVGPSTVVLLEHAPSGSRAWYTSWQLASQGIGIAMGAASAAVLSHVLPHDDLYAWGWRIPFLCGAAILPVGVYIRRRLAEHAPDAGEARESRQPLRTLLTEHKRNVFGGVLLLMGGTITAYMIIFFIPTFAIRELKLGESGSYACAFVSGVMLAVLSPLAGKIADAKGRIVPILIGRAILILGIYPAYLWLSSAPSVTRLFVVIVCLIVPYTIQGSPSVTLISELFPKSVRVTAMGTVYSLAVAVFGGLMQPVSVWLVEFTRRPFALAIAVTIGLLLSTLSLLVIRRNRNL
ncbi:MFS transporter [Pandoraea anhela]|uniref:Proline/betaine transporter n=1 Tax=Pandoraea anhela TaxID=2508295 RepID=A0A5E4X1H1_9BURK|nr:MFS transporter [Pandoraea anhela]VVE30137.1 Proline/betaine transporter [Pandoraea anhela]